MPDYNKKLVNLKARRQDSSTRLFSLKESFNTIGFGVATKYALEAMEAISKDYTANTYKICQKVQSHLKPGLKEYGIEVSFRFQGSVPTDTHIKNYSDIDMLTLHEGFYSLQAPQVPSSPYLGNPLEDLKEMRKKIFRILDTVYSAADIDDTGSKALSISGGSLDRKIDIIASNWLNTNKYVETNDEDYRHVYILDRDKNQRIENAPFMHIYWINYKDTLVGGSEKRLIRLLKSLKSDADAPIKVSSYDIASLVYRIADSELRVEKNQHLKLLLNCNQYLLKVIYDESFRESLYVANGLRKIFCPEGANVLEVTKLQKEVLELILQISAEVRPVYSSIENANIYY
jgi:hypothetical protein